MREVCEQTYLCLMKFFLFLFLQLFHLQPGFQVTFDIYIIKNSVNNSR